MANELKDFIGILFKEESSSSDYILPVCKSIESKEVTLLQLIEELKPFLLHNEVLIRRKAVLVVAQILERSNFNEKENDLLTEFFCSKLEDHHSILPAALQGIFALSSASQLPLGAAELIARSIFQHVHCQSQLQNDRRRIYLTFKNLLTSKLEEMQVMGKDLVFGIIQVADQERDPRNLTILFSLFPLVAKYFQLEPFVEDFFEVFSCYFPIDFTPSPDDPNGVTREQLTNGLRQCLSSNSQFAEYCLPLLHEKLDSDLVSAKIEALRALECCCQIFLPSQLEMWIEIFWSCIKKEVLININEDELEHAALDTLTALARSFSSENHFRSPIFMKVLEAILKECLGHLCEPERRLMTPSSYILLAICAGSQLACNLIISQVIPVLLDQYRSRPQLTARQFVLNTLNKMVHAGLYGFNSENVKGSEVDRAGEDLLTVYLDILNGQEDATLHSLSLQGLSHFVGVRLSDPESDKINESIVCLLKRPGTTDNVVDDICQFLNKMAVADERRVVERVIPQLFDIILLPESDGTKRAFQLMTRLPPLPLIYNATVPRLMHILEHGDSAHKTGILHVLSEICKNQTDVKTGDLELFQRLLSWTWLISNNDTCDYIAASCHLLRNLSTNIQPSDAVDVIHAQIGRYVEQSNSPMALLILEAAIGSLNAVPHGSQLDELISTLENVALESAHSDEVKESACRLIAAIVNKLPEGQDMERVMNLLDQKRSAPSVNKENAIRLFIWTTKAMVMRAYSRTSALIEELVGLLNDPVHGCGMVAEGFATILSEPEECLNLDSHANIRLMYRQRFFQDTVPRLLALYQQSKQSNGACFAAIANQLAFVPHAVIISHMATLVPLLVQCLAIEQQNRLIISTINALLGLMRDNTLALVDHIDTLVPRLLTLATDAPTMVVRSLALKCLSELVTAPTVVLLPLRDKVNRELIPCLGDKKRLVRREAALARHRWIMLGQPGGK